MLGLSARTVRTICLSATLISFAVPVSSERGRAARTGLALYTPSSCAYAIATVPFIASIDTMKESQDTLLHPLTDAQITEDVDTTASLRVTHVTEDVPWDYPRYMYKWIRAIRAAGKHVWFRSTFDAWDDIYGAAPTMTPADYIAALQRFIAAHPGFFRPGDILDPLPEPEIGPYWARTSPYGTSWGWKNPPNATTDAYNTFFVNLTRATRDALHAAGVTGVTTNIRSTNPWFASRPHALYPATVAQIGRVTTDMYVGQATTITPALALRQFQRQIESIERLRGVPLVLGEFGYSLQGLVSDRQQQAVLAPQLAWMRTQPYIQGANYWHGAGYPSPDTINGAKVFTGTIGAWTPRPAARDLASFFGSEGRLHHSCAPLAGR